MCVCVLSHVQLFTTPWTIACQTPLFMGFSRQEYWSGLPFPHSFPFPGIKPAYPTLAGGFFIKYPTGKPSKLRNFLHLPMTSLIIILV